MTAHLLFPSCSGLPLHNTYDHFIFEILTLYEFKLTSVSDIIHLGTQCQAKKLRVKQIMFCNKFGNMNICNTRKKAQFVIFNL